MCSTGENNGIQISARLLWEFGDISVHFYSTFTITCDSYVDDENIQRYRESSEQ